MFFGEEDLRTSGRLNPEGNLSLPCWARSMLAGLNLTQAASKLTSYRPRLSGEPKGPMSAFSATAKRRFSILGQVGHPAVMNCPRQSGRYRSAGGGRDRRGFTRIAAPERITVRRHNASAIRFSRSTRNAHQGKRRGLSHRAGDTITVGGKYFLIENFCASPFERSSWCKVRAKILP